MDKTSSRKRDAWKNPIDMNSKTQTDTARIEQLIDFAMTIRNSTIQPATRRFHRQEVTTMPCVEINDMIVTNSKNTAACTSHGNSADHSFLI